MGAGIMNLLIPTVVAISVVIGIWIIDPPRNGLEIVLMVASGAVGGLVTWALRTRRQRHQVRALQEASPIAPDRSDSGGSRE